MTYDRYYYTRLSDREKKIYKTIYNGLTAFAPGIHISTLTGLGIDPVKILYAVDMDNPHLFYVDFRHIPGHITALEKVLQPSYLYTPQETKQMQAKIQTILQKILSKVNGSTDYERELSLHDILVRNVLYDHVAANNLDAYANRSNTILGVLFYKSAVCEGIAKTTKLLLNALNIKCVVVTGKASRPDDPAPGDVSHAWNLVKIGDRPSWLDVTWDVNLSGKSCIRHDYFNLSDAQIARDHVADGVFPPCPATDMDYYTHTGTILRRKEDLQRLLSAAVRSGQNGISFRKEIGVGMTDQEIVQAAIQTLSVLFPSRDRIGVQFSVNQSQNIMELGW